MTVERWAALGVGVLGSLLAWLRLPSGARGVVWAEDGWEFLQDRLDEPGRVHLLDVYEGYLHVVPRLVVDLVATVLPPSAFAQGLTVVCCLVVGLLAAVVFVCSGSVMSYLPARLALAGVTVLAPAATQEVLGNAANLHWYFLWATPWILMHRPARPVSSWLLGLLLLAGALTEIQVAVFAPLALLAVRERRRWPMLAGYAIGLAGQVFATVTSPRSDNPLEPASLLGRLEGFLLNPVLSMVTAHGQDWVVLHLGWWVPAVLAGTVAAAGVLVIMRGGRARSVAALTCGLAAGAVYLASVTLNPDPSTAYDVYTAARWRHYEAPRYSVVPSMFLTAVLLLGVDAVLRPGAVPAEPRATRRASRRASRRSTRRATRRATSTGPHSVWLRGLALVVLLAVVAVQAVHAYPGRTYRDGASAWAPQVHSAVESCRGSSPDAGILFAIAPSFGAVSTTCGAFLDWVG